jgi:hypothetical protein
MKANDILEGKPEKPRGGYQAFELSNADRSKLAQVFPPKFPEFIGHHITYKRGAKSDQPLPEASTFKVVGYACDPDGVEALVVTVDGTTTRPDGKTFHITWSIDREAGFKPVSSNDLIERLGYEPLPNAINITATAKFF